MLRRRGCITSGYVGRRKLTLAHWMLSLFKNHLIETASASTGSLLIWDTGQYEMLPYRRNIEQVTDEEMSGDSDGSSSLSSSLSDSEKLHAAFQNVGHSIIRHSYDFTKLSSAQNSDPLSRDPFTTRLHPVHSSPDLGKSSRTACQTFQKTS